MKRTIFVLLLAVTLFSGCAKRTFYLKIAPPENRTEIRSERPGIKFVWVDGHWQWNRKKENYVWIPGHWIKKKEGKIWIHGDWHRTRRGWVWVKSYWK
ncbi:MAG: BcpO-related WXXGXW repeat protein [Candidatus Cloacimonetes bacterium]|jgi:hypothetical protein|nr:BcpO-related WXXGXW repeat protein [Candidatus Cloacimonadota bacterium]